MKKNQFYFLLYEFLEKDQGRRMTCEVAKYNLKIVFSFCTSIAVDVFAEAVLSYFMQVLNSYRPKRKEKLIFIIDFEQIIQ